ncbi:MAG TPA: sporulation phosphorelay system protein KapB [Virgibacillus sp.]|nr:sporulation phosphorelay system protein KapB [Virgibacillus sp.]
MAEIKVGDIVEAHYNSGIYIGEMMEDRRNFLLVKVLAVKKHPAQGDLHNPGQVEGIAFFERKALAHQEMMNVQRRKVHPYDGEIPSYNESLKLAVHKLKNELSQEDTLFNKASLQKLRDLEEHYYNKILE